MSSFAEVTVLDAVQPGATPKDIANAICGATQGGLDAELGDYRVSNECARSALYSTCGWNALNC